MCDLAQVGLIFSYLLFSWVLLKIKDYLSRSLLSMCFRFAGETKRLRVFTLFFP